MNKDYWEYYFSKKKKLTDRAFKVRIAMLMCSMVACTAVMASSAFALFTCDINSQTQLKAATFRVVDWKPAQMQTDELNVTHIVDIETTPGVLGYCRIPVYDKYNTVRYYYTEAFSSGHIQVKIATAAEASVGKPDGFWGYPRNYIDDSEITYLGNGAMAVHSHATPEPESESGSDGETTVEETKEIDNTPTVEETEKKITVSSPTEETKTPVVEKTPASEVENRLTETPVAPPSEKGNVTEKQKIESKPVQKVETPVKVTDIKPATASENNDAGSGNGDSSGSSSSDAPAPAASSAGGDSPSDGGGE